MNIFAHQLAPGHSFDVHPGDRVTVAEVTRRDSRWVSNGIVMFTATNGHRYGIDRNRVINLED